MTTKEKGNANDAVEDLTLYQIYEAMNSNNRDIMITLPSVVDWGAYERELAKVADYREVMNFKVSHFPRGVRKGSRCYIVHKGAVKGWMEIVGFSTKKFDCSTTGKEWDGNFIERSGPFHYLKQEIPMRGFQGFRYFSLEKYTNEQ